MLRAFLEGVWLGFCIAAPVGPIGVMALKQSLQAGRGAGLASGLGAALADLIYGLLAVAGVRLVAGHERGVALLGGIVLLGLAWKSWREKPAGEAVVEQRRSLTASCAATFVLTLSNPLTIISFAAMVASVGIGAPGYFVAGVFTGSMTWWLVLSSTAAWIGGVVELRGTALDRLAAATLAGFGTYAIWKGFVR